MIKNDLPKTDLQTKDFYYDLPEELIAQTPIEPRDHSRMMVLRKNGDIEHKHFYDVIDYLNEGDVLVINDSRVIPARIYGDKVRDEGIFVSAPSKIETLLLKQIDGNKWEVLLRPAKKVKIGGKIDYNGILQAPVCDVVEDVNIIVEFSFDKEKYSSIYEVLDIIGSMPLPPYITKKLEDKNRYQTVYSKIEGSAAAPTAGLHFTNELLEKLRTKGVKTAFVTLHVGLGTFRPVSVDKIEEHKMHTEFYQVSKETADIINETRKNGGRIVCVGTTSVRTLESSSQDNGTVLAGSGDTSIFIYPGYKFKTVDSLITNFHLPESTLLMLISALYNRDSIMQAYNEAIKERYRFFSFGDAMFIV